MQECKICGGDNKRFLQIIERQKKGKEEIMNNHNEHYMEMPFEPLKIMEKILTKQEYIGFIKGSIIKYRFRAGHKGQAQDDIDKATYYEELLKCERMIGDGK